MRLEVGAALGHQPGLGVGDLKAVRDGGAAGECRRADGGGRMRVHPDALALPFASSQAARICASVSVWPPPSRMLLDGEDLDHVGAVAAVLRTYWRIWSGVRVSS